MRILLEEFRMEPISEPFCCDPNDPYLWMNKKQYERLYDAWIEDQASYHELFEKDNL